MRRAKQLDLTEEPHLATALGASIEVLAQTKEKQGDHAGSVRFLKRVCEIPCNSHQCEDPTSTGAGTGNSAMAWFEAAVPGQVVRAASPTVLLGALLRGLPGGRPGVGADCGTVRPGRVRANRCYPAIRASRRTWAKASRTGAGRQHIGHMFRRYYQGLSEMPLIINERNFITYGASTTPTLVLLDRRCFVSLYRPGKMGFHELARRVKALIHPLDTEAYRR